MGQNDIVNEYMVGTDTLDPHSRHQQTSLAALHWNCFREVLDSILGLDIG
jgi:hypothetical protein